MRMLKKYIYFFSLQILPPNGEMRNTSKNTFIVIKCSNISARMEVFGTNHDRKK